jgi:Putative peptidoglycan binding domain
MKLIYSLLLLVAFSLSANQLFAQYEPMDVPTNAEPGKCYARCYVPDEYDMRSEQVIDIPARQKIVVIPAEYSNIVETLLVRQSASRMELIPATYSMVAETIMISNASTKWVKGRADAACLSDNPDNCSVLCLVQVPAQYRVQMRRVMSTPASSREIAIAAEYQYVPRRILSKPSENQVIEIPAIYKTVTEKVLVKKGGFGEWREILCASQLSEERIIAIQRALLNKGYNPGPIDNVFGSQTKQALLRYQQDNHLPQGNLNMETLQSLGVM